MRLAQLAVLGNWRSSLSSNKMHTTLMKGNVEIVGKTPKVPGHALPIGKPNKRDYNSYIVKLFGDRILQRCTINDFGVPFAQMIDHSPNGFNGLHDGTRLDLGPGVGEPRAGYYFGNDFSRFDDPGLIPAIGQTNGSHLLWFKADASSLIDGNYHTVTVWSFGNDPDNRIVFQKEQADKTYTFNVNCGVGNAVIETVLDYEPVDYTLMTITWENLDIGGAFRFYLEGDQIGDAWVPGQGFDFQMYRAFIGGGIFGRAFAGFLSQHLVLSDAATSAEIKQVNQLGKLV